jgi:tRNA (guanine-N7-)-methyltransferase
MRSLWLEVGFGAGEHLTAQAQANPDIGLIGCEHYIDGVSSCLSRIESEGVPNVRVHHGDARDLMDALPDGSVGRAFLLYPDPWPKARHHKRRFVNPENLASFARVMEEGAHLRVASDIPEYIDWTREQLAGHPDFAPVSDTGEPWADWPGTRYEAKALREGRVPHYLTYGRVVSNTAPEAAS